MPPDGVTLAAPSFLVGPETCVLVDVTFKTVGCEMAEAELETTQPLASRARTLTVPADKPEILLEVWPFDQV